MTTYKRRKIFETCNFEDVRLFFKIINKIEYDYEGLLNTFCENKNTDNSTIISTLAPELNISSREIDKLYNDFRSNIEKLL